MDENDKVLLTKQFTFSGAVEEATLCASNYLLNDFSYQPARSSHLTLLMIGEVRQYFESGNWGKGSKAASVNPTFLQAPTGKWYLGHTICPFHGYLPLPIKELRHAKKVKKGIIADYCRSELKKLLTEYRKRMEKVVFYFHPGDAMVFCYGDLPYKFDIIDTSTLVDTLGLANLLNAAGRKLLSDQSMLITESKYWYNIAPTVAQFVQEMLFCPLNLIPTIYGFRLMDNVEWGQVEPRCTSTMDAMPARLRWKKTRPFDQVPLVLTPCLERSLQLLMDACSVHPFIASAKRTIYEAIIRRFSPLTFCYVLSDLIHRGGIKDPSALMDTFFSGLRPVFKTSFETCRAWVENRPVWRVTISFDPMALKLFDGSLEENRVLRLILVPSKDSLSPSFAAAEMTDFYSTANHFIDNLKVRYKIESSDIIESFEVAFLLRDRSVIDSHTGIIVNSNGDPTFCIGPLSDCHHSVELFTLPYPWLCEGPTIRHPDASAATSASNEPQLFGHSCEETENSYTIRFKILFSENKHYLR